MPPTLRSASRAPSSNSRQSTPLDAPVLGKRPSSFVGPARPKKQRRTGRNTRVGIDPQDENTEQGSKDPADSELGRIDEDTPWVEPPLRDPAPSYADTPWSAICNASNPILATMRPLGAMPTAADLRLAGLKPVKPTKAVAPMSRELQALQNEVSQNEVSTEMSQTEEVPLSQSETPQMSPEELPKESQNLNIQATQNGGDDAQNSEMPAGESHPNGTKPCSYEEIDELMSLPLSDLVTLDLEHTKRILTEALRLATDSYNHPVVKGLFNLWTKGTQDPMIMSILHAVCSRDPGDRKEDAFSTVMRSAWLEVRGQDEVDIPLVAEATRTLDAALAADAARTLNAALAAAARLDADLEADATGTLDGVTHATDTAPVNAPLMAAPTDMARTQSVTTATSLSSAISLDAEATTATAARRTKSRGKGKKAKSTAKKPDNKETLPTFTRKSVFPSSEDRKRAMEEDPEFSEETLRVKRQRLQQPLPEIVPEESSLRSTLALEPPPNFLSSDVAFVGERQATPGPATVNGRERSESPESSGAENNRRLTPSLEEDSLDNSDLCRECNRRGQLLCCDGCVNSFHFSCLNPPLDPANPPEGDWFCPRCEIARPFGKMMDKIGAAKTKEKEFSLPASIRNHYAGVKTGARVGDRFDRTRYNETSVNLVNGVGRGLCNGYYDDPNLLKIRDAENNIIFCHRCGQTSEGVKPILQCDYCHLNWHLDCMDPPMAKPPIQDPKFDKRWRCPNHVEHDLWYYKWNDEGAYDRHKIRRPKRPRMIDVEILPDEEESERIENEMDEGDGILYRVSERGIQTAFIAKVKRENAEYEYAKQATDKYFEEARAKLNDLHAQAFEYYASQRPAPLPDAETAILNSRTEADREAALSLVALARGEGVEDPSRISHLIDTLMSDAPELPDAQTEIESLRKLQGLIDRRIRRLAEGALVPESAGEEAPDV